MFITLKRHTDWATKLTRHNNNIDRSSIIKPVLIGTLLLNVSLAILLCTSIFVFENWHVVERLYIVLIATAYSSICLYLFSINKLVLSSVGVILYFFAGATLISLSWGLNVPFSILLYSFVILLSSIMLGPKFVIPTTGIVATTLFSNQLLIGLGIVTVDTSHLSQPSDFFDVATYSAIFGVFSVLGWASGSKLENLIIDLSRARKKLKAQNKIIQNELEEEKRHLQLAQIEELVILQQFADLGQNTSIILHELANQLSVIALDDKSVSKKDKVMDIDITIKEVEKLIKNANNKLKPHAAQLFAIGSLIDKHIETFRYHANKNKIKILYKNLLNEDNVMVFGDPYRLEQIITILINNAFEAYTDSNTISRRQIEVLIKNDKQSIFIQIKDYGKGMNEKQRNEIFTNIQSSKSNGHGIGLYVSGHIIRRHFRGSIKLESFKKPTTFIITLPITSPQ